MRGWGTDPGLVLSPGGTGDMGASLNSRKSLLRARNLGMERKRTVSTKCDLTDNV